MPRFVVLRHESPRGLHWDLMLESGEVLKTWALPAPPASSKPLIVEALSDHRRAYLDYEGPISGDRGEVARWDSGSYRLERQSETQWVVQLKGEHIAGLATLDRLSETIDQWRLELKDEG